jgi:hypothetical protein
MRAILISLSLMCICQGAEPLTQEQEKNARDQALAGYLAQGGGLRKSGSDNKVGAVFTQGKLKGLTKEQATQKFNSIWVKVGPEVKAKYAALGPVPTEEGKPDDSPEKEQDRIRRELELRRIRDQIERLTR